MSVFKYRRLKLLCTPVATTHCGFLVSVVMQPYSLLRVLPSVTLSASYSIWWLHRFWKLPCLW